MNLYTKLVANVLFPLHENIKKHNSISVCQQLEKSQWHSREQLAQAQNDKFLVFIKDVVLNVPYYQQLFSKSSLRLDDIQSVNDLTLIPLLTKREIKQNFADFCHVDSTNLSTGNTGGSSGSPLIFLFGKDRTSHDVGAKLRATRWWDVDIGDKEVVAWGSPIELGKQDRIKMVRDVLLRTTLIPAFNLNEDNLQAFLEKIRTIKPKMLFGYPSVFDLLAKHALKHEVQMDNLGIKVAFVTSERLYDYQRENIEKVFGCPVANGYGGRDSGFIAHQCPSGSMHISSEDIIVELINREGQPVADGELGEIVITHLASKDFPFIRYRTGDIASFQPEPCKCGRGLPVLKEIQGRDTDFIVARDGTIMHGLALIYVIREHDFVEDFKIIQQSLSLTQVLIVANISIAPEQISTIREGIKQRLGEDVEVDIEQVEAIPAEKSGKFRYVISHVKVEV